MSDTVTAIVGHRLGKVEAVRRLKEGFARTNGNLGLIAMEHAPTPDVATLSGLQGAHE